MKINHMFISETKRTPRALALLFGLAMMICALLLDLQSATTKPVLAAGPTFTVNSIGDENDLDFPGGTFDGSSDGKCDVESSTAGEQCTLRAAIQQANLTKGADNSIGFDIPGSGVKTISPGSQLPAITKRVTIDGYTQPNASRNTVPLAKDGTNAVLMIELDGTNAGSAATGLVLIGPGASNSVIRGLVINHFKFNGIALGGGKGYKVEGNFIGTDPTGTVAEGNNSPGVNIIGARNSTIGGTSPDKRNLISGNRFQGILVIERANNNKIEGNLIGTNKDGTSTPNNLGNDVGVVVSSPSNTIGDSDPSDGATNASNTIAFNTNRGVQIQGGTLSTGNRILSNSIFSNGKLGIDLQGGTEDSFGATPNDPDDPNTPKPDPDKDTGPNRLQNFPEINSATTFPTFTSIKGTLESTPSTRHKKRTFIIQFFSSPDGNSSGFVEGQTFLGQIQVSTNRQGKAFISFVPAQKVPVGQFITATATNKKTGDTSEFSQAKVVEPPVIEP